MTLTPKQLTAIQRAKERVAGSAISLDRIYFDEPFTFTFLPTLTQPALEIISQVQNAPATDVMKQFDWLVKFIDVMATEETGELIAQLSTAGIMTIGDLVDVQQAVISAVAARPTMRSSLSADGSPSTGSPSTASAQPEESTLPA